MIDAIFYLAEYLSVVNTKLYITKMYVYLIMYQCNKINISYYIVNNIWYLCVQLYTSFFNRDHIYGKTKRGWVSSNK